MLQLVAKYLQKEPEIQDKISSFLVRTDHFFSREN